MLQSDASSVVAFLRGTKARVLLLTVKKTSYLLVLQFVFVLYVRSLCPYVSACKPVSCQYGFTRVRPRQIPPFEFIMKVLLGLKKNTSACFPCRWFAIIFEQIRTRFPSIMHAHYTVKYATTATEHAVWEKPHLRLLLK